MSARNPFESRSIMPRGVPAITRPDGKTPFGVEVDMAPRRFDAKGAGDGGAPSPRGLAGGPASAAGPQGSSVTTNETVAARFTPAIVTNPLQLIGSAANLVGYRAIDIDRPTIIYTLTPTLEGPLLYHPLRIPGRDLDCNRSQGHGIAYLSNPGTWWVKYAAAGTIEVILIDASDPAVASKYLSEPGTHLGQFQGGTLVNSNLVVTNLLPANIRRKAVFIQNLATTIPVRIGWDNSTTVTLTPPNGPGGVRLGGPSGSTITLSGDMLTKSAIDAALESATAPAQLIVVEWT